jgi:hypothetical protein
VVTDRFVFQAAPETAVQRLGAIASLKAAVETRELRRYIGENRGKGIAWVMIDFQPSEKDVKRWTFLQMQICVDQAHARVGSQIRSEIVKTLGAGKKENGRTVWPLGRHRELSIRTGAFDPPTGLAPVAGMLIELAVLQGEEN